MKKRFSLIVVIFTSLMSFGWDNYAISHKNCNIWKVKDETSAIDQILESKGYNINFLDGKQVFTPRGDLFLNITHYRCYEVLSPSPDRVNCYFDLFLYEKTASSYISESEKMASSQVRFKPKELVGGSAKIVEKFYLQLVSKLPRCETFN